VPNLLVSGAAASRLRPLAGLPTNYSAFLRRITIRPKRTTAKIEHTRRTVDESMISPSQLLENVPAFDRSTPRAAGWRISNFAGESNNNRTA
jgi:hypothetical protein